MSPLEWATYLVALVASAALGVVVLRAAPRAPTNRTLAVVLGMWAAFWAFRIIALSANDVWLAYNASAYASMIAWAISPVYLVFVSEAIRSRWTRPLRAPIARVILVALGLAWPVVLFLDPPSWLTVVKSGGSFTIENGAARPWHPWNHVATFSFTLFVAVHAWFRAPPESVARARAGAYAVAFGVMDADVLVVQIGGVVPGLSVLDPLGDSVIFFPTVFLVFALLLTRAMLKYQLFDFELKVKWTLNRGTIAAIFVAAFFAVSELASGLLSEQIGLVAGVLATALLVFALAPLQRLADRVADTAMPRVQDTEEYRTVRKREVYRAAVESAMQDGVVTERERDVLATLATELGLSAADARALERAVAGSIQGVVPG